MSEAPAAFPPPPTFPPPPADVAPTGANPVAGAFRLLFSPSGRVGRGAYLLGLLVWFALFIAALLIADPELLGGERRGYSVAAVAIAALGWWSWLALLVKRLRDVGLSRFWALLMLVPGLQVFVLLGFAFPRSQISRNAS